MTPSIPYNVFSIVRDILSAVGDIMGTMGDVQYRGDNIGTMVDIIITLRNVQYPHIFHVNH